MEHSKHTVWPYPPEIKPARQFTWREATTSMVIVILAIAILIPVFCKGTYSGSRPTCIINMKFSSLAVRMYAEDYDDRIPAKDWMDAAYPYSKNWSYYGCMEVRSSNPDEFGHSLESTLVNVPISKVKMPENRIFMYDSSVLTKSAMAPFHANMARPARHNNKNSIGFVDGHIRSLSVKQSTSLNH